MNTKLTVIFLASLLLFVVFLNNDFAITTQAEETPDVYVGIDMAYGGNSQTLIDQVSSYTNLIIFGAGATDQMCQYAYDKGMSFIIFGMTLPTKTWLENAKNKWGNSLLGLSLQG